MKVIRQEPRCATCQSKRKLVEHKGLMICASCHHAAHQLILPLPRANRAYDPRVYDILWQRGRDAALAGQHRRAPGFQYGYEADCWFDGYDDVKNVPAEV